MVRKIKRRNSSKKKDKRFRTRKYSSSSYESDSDREKKLSSEDLYIDNGSSESSKEE